ncbi:protein kinase [Myxococcaceae bacterium GXIMD 01537]
MRAVEDDYIGRIIAQKYRVEALIGEGGMGKVFRARQLALDKVVVLKVLRQSLLSDERTVARFQREAKAASRLNHPNSISVLDFGQTEDGALFIAMEFVSGQDLHQLLGREWPLAEGRVVRIVSQVLSALSDAHGAGVIHRDLKPENIMVEQRRGEPDFVKVLDFGIAKITDSSGEEGPALTRAGFVCGTPEYMSPEQARGSSLDHRSDLYAVGVILYQLTTGLLPFESDSAVGFATKHLTEEPPPPSERRPDARISPGMEGLILRALSKDPNDRPADAEMFRAELLEVDKERRRGEASARRPKGKTAGTGVLAPLPRRASAAEQIDTNPSTVPGWSAPPAHESTVRAVPEQMRTVPNPVPAPQAARGITEEEVPAAEGGFSILKALTVLLALGALAAGGYYYYTHLRNVPPEAPFVPPPNAPVPGQTSSASPAENALPLYEQRFRAQDVPGSLKAEQEGDAHQETGQYQLAASAFRRAYQLNPRPELTLKLAAVYRMLNPAEAVGWLQRFLKDEPNSKQRARVEADIRSLTDASGAN